MKGFLIFGLIHLIGGTLIGLATIGFGVDFLCYLCEKEMLFQMSNLCWIGGIGIVVEIMAVIIGCMFITKGN